MQFTTSRFDGHGFGAIDWHDIAGSYSSALSQKGYGDKQGLTSECLVPRLLFENLFGGCAVVWLAQAARSTRCARLVVSSG